MTRDFAMERVCGRRGFTYDEYDDDEYDEYDVDEYDDDDDDDDWVSSFSSTTVTFSFSFSSSSVSVYPGMRSQLISHSSSSGQSGSESS